VLSFFVVGVIWVNHLALIALLGRVDRPLLFYNLLLLLFVTTIPFTTSTLASFLQVGGWDGRLAAVLYGISMEGMAIGFTLMLRHVLKRGMTTAPVAKADGRRAVRRFGLGLYVYPLVTSVRLWSPPAMLALMGLLTLWYIAEQTPIVPNRPAESESAEV